MSLITIAAAAIPWDKIISLMPVLIDSARGVIDKNKKQSKLLLEDNSSDIRELKMRVEELEANELRQAKLVEEITVQLGELTKAMNIISKRVIVGLVIAITSLVLGIVLMIVK
ncbi:MAG: hypothetical protein ABI528_04280 [bacterium]